MLTLREQRRIRERGLSIRHDYQTNLLCFGEPFLQEGMLVFYDGRTVRLCALPLRSESAPDENTVLGLAARWARCRDVEEICYTGTRPLAGESLSDSGLRSTERGGGSSTSAELLIDCFPDAPVFVASRPYRRALRGVLAARAHLGAPPSAAILHLLERFCTSRIVARCDPEALISLPTLVTSRWVHLIEAWQDGELRGVVGLHKPFRDVAVALFLAHDDWTEGVCDFLYAQMLDHARSLGAILLNVGPSPSMGHLRFKEKWGGRAGVPPYYWCRWARRQLARRHRSSSWAARMLGIR